MKEKLLESLRSDDKDVVREAVEMLSEYEDEDVIKALVDTAIEKKSKAVLEAVKNVLISFKSKSECVCKEVMRMFEIEEPKLRQAAIEIVSSKGNVCLPLVKEKLLVHEDYNMRKFGIDILSNIKTRESLEMLKDMLKDENPNVKYTALEYLRNFSEYADKLSDILKEVLSDIKDLYGITTFASTVIYGNIKVKELEKDLINKLKEVEDPMFKHWIYKILIYLGNKDIKEEAVKNAEKIGMVEDIKKDFAIFGESEQQC